MYQTQPVNSALRELSVIGYLNLEYTRAFL